VTKVLRRLSLMLVILVTVPQTLLAQQTAGPSCPQKAAELYMQLRTVGLDPQRVYHVRGASVDRPNFHLDLEDGTLGFTSDICGRITGAMFEGEGEILLRPPNKVERESMALFTGMAILEEPVTSAYLRFNDDTAEQLQSYLLPGADGGDFVRQAKDTANALAESDGLRLFLDFSRLLPASDGSKATQAFAPMLHVHLMGRKLGSFEVYYDSASAESLWAGQPQLRNGVPFFDIWTSFAPQSPGGGKFAEAISGSVAIASYRIQATVQPPTLLKASAELEIHVKKDGQRTLLLELSRFLKVDTVQQGGRPLEFIQNQTLEGTELRRKGNDLVAVVFPAPLRSGQDMKLNFTYAGEVLSEAGTGLLYVGERGTWYPNFGLSPAQFDLQFSYPAGWTLVATGKSLPLTDPEKQADPNLQRSHWISERPIPVAGFNLGKYLRAEAKADKVDVEVYATKVVERSFPKAPSEVIEQPKSFPGRPQIPAPPPIVITPGSPSPARNAQAVANRAANAITSFEQWFGPYPFSTLALTQMPGDLSQGWPGLIFLSSFAFLTPQERSELHLDPVTSTLNSQVLVHETAHQWWGDLVLWKTYRDQWISEGLSNYSSMLVLEQQNPAEFRQVLQRYRDDLLSRNKDGEPIREAGPVTLGTRLISSHFPGGYDAISYERGTWLFHMLRCMLRDAEVTSHSRNGRPNAEEPFFRGLRRLRQHYAGKAIGTRELVDVFGEELPRSLWYENHHTLDWFLEGWINGTSIPHFETRDVKITQKEHGSVVSGVILQKEAPDDLVTAVPVYAVLANNSQSLIGQVLADGAETPFHLTAPAGARKIVLDPEQTILSAPK
jgi:peptidase M1-like protein